MPLSFVNPALLFGAAGRGPAGDHPFPEPAPGAAPALQRPAFLDEVQARQARSLGMRRWLLLLLRVLAILLSPWPWPGPAGAGLAPRAGTRSVLFVVDTSASMSTQTGRGHAPGRGGGRLRRDDRCPAGRSRGPGDHRRQPDRAPVRRLAARRAPAPWAGWTAVRQPTAPSTWPRCCARRRARSPGRPARPVEVVVLSATCRTCPAPRTWRPAAARLARGRRRRGSWCAGSASRSPAAACCAVDLPRRGLRPGENVDLAATVLPDCDGPGLHPRTGRAPVAEAVAAGPPGGARGRSISR